MKDKFAILLSLSENHAAWLMKLKLTVKNINTIKCFQENTERTFSKLHPTSIP